MNKYPGETRLLVAIDCIIFGFDGSKKWIARLGRAGISRSGWGAPTASGAKKALGLFRLMSVSSRTPAAYRSPARQNGPVSTDSGEDHHG